MEAGHQSTTTQLLSGVTFQYFIATIILLVNLTKQEIYRLICYIFEKEIYLVLVIFVLTVWWLKKSGGNNKTMECGMYVLMTVSLSWSIVYLCWFFSIEEVLNIAATLFSSCLGLRVYSSLANANFSDKYDMIGGT